MKKPLLTSNGWILFAGLISFLSFSANAQHNNSNKKPVNMAGTQQKRADIYLAGCSMPDGKTPVATYLKNGVATLLANTQSESEIASLVVVGNDIYAAGTHNGQAVYWKNGTEIQLSNISGKRIFGRAYDMAVDSRNGDVYVVGYERIYDRDDMYSPFRDWARCWKNGKQVLLTAIERSYATSVAIDYKTGDVYVAGKDDAYTKYWKNGAPVKIINDPLPVVPASIHIANNDFYIPGIYYEPAGNSSSVYYRVAYWCGAKGTVFLTDRSQNEARSTAIAVSGSNVYVAGWENGFAKYWKNGVPTVLTKLTDYPRPYKIAADGDDVYVAGWGEQDGSSGIRYWKNGQLAGTFTNFMINDIVAARQGDNLVKNLNPTPAVKETQPVIAQPPPAPVASTLEEDARKFLADNKKKPGVITTVSGLQYEIIKQGTGSKPLASDKVKFDFRRTILIGGKFKETAVSPSPLNKVVDDLLPGLWEGIQLMNVGSKYRLFFPARLGFYKPTPEYPASAVTFIWEIELLEILK